MMSDIKIDPRTKLVLVLLISSIAIASSKLGVLAFLLATSLTVALVMKSSLPAILARYKKLLGVMAAIAVTQSLFQHAGKPLVTIGSAAVITDFGARRALEFMLRLGIIIASASIITTSNSREIVQGLIQWHCPYEIAFMTSVAIRFLPMFKEELTDMVTAIQLRGIDLKHIRFSEKLKVYRYMLFPIVINSILRARELSSAMEMRGFRAYPARTSYMVLKMNRADYAIITLSIAAAAAAIIWIIV
ncbi:MAG: energy-coupling factor transporter transmembrane component T [Sedimentibacter sp.]|uniref:energy-coupling factor transporter transmembrane component T family protein n=1 Tax=Sedimentibacter sp. TaxID=1960295 RepID=UPI003158BA5E